MSWILRYRCRMFLRSSMCAAPIASMVVAMAAAPLIRMLDNQTQWTLLGYELDGARAIIGALGASILTLIVFSFSIMLLAVQVAGGQLSPRIVARIFEARFTKGALSAFVFSFTYSLAALGRIDERVPQLPLLIAVVSSCCSIGLFLYLIQSASKSFRPVIILTDVAADTRTVIGTLYPNPLGSGEGSQAERFPVNAAVRSVIHAGPPGVVLSVDAAGLAGIAAGAGGAIELVPQVGDFLAAGEELFRIHGGRADGVDDDVLRRSVALGPERTLDQDPAFGFRIIVDIAIKALSPAINDPTTAVLAVDQLHHLLHLLSQRELDAGVLRDSSGTVRLAYRTPCWQDFVSLAVTEIRLCSPGNPQVTRRLQAMFEHLIQVVPAERSAALRGELALLGRTIDNGFTDPEDRIIAGTGDLQGFGSRQNLYYPERAHGRALGLEKAKENRP